MKEFQLQIVTPDGLFYDGPAQELIVRTTAGDVGIMADHLEYVAAVDIGVTQVKTAEGATRLAACSGGLLTVGKEVTRLIPSAFEWQEDIDRDRAQRAKERAEGLIAQAGADKAALKTAVDAKRRAEVRLKLSSK